MERGAATNRCVDLTVPIRGHGGRRRGSLAAIVAELLESPSQSQLQRETDARMRVRPLSATVSGVDVRRASRWEPEMRGRRGEREERKKGAHVMPSFVARGLKLRVGTWPLCESATLQLEYIHNTQGAEAAARVYASIGSLFSRAVATNVKGKE